MRGDENDTYWDKTRPKNPDGAACQVRPFTSSWQCIFRTLANKVVFLLYILYSCFKSVVYLNLVINKLDRKWVTVQLIMK